MVAWFLRIMICEESVEEVWDRFTFRVAWVSSRKEFRSFFFWVSNFCQRLELCRVVSINYFGLYFSQ